MSWFGLGRSPGEGNDNPLQYSCLENSMDRGSWWATVHGVTKSQLWLKQLNDWSELAHVHAPITYLHLLTVSRSSGSSNYNFALLNFAIWYWNTFFKNVVILYIILMCISHFMFFANDLLLAVYFIFILDYRNYVRQKANSSDFLIRVQNVS